MNHLYTPRYRPMDAYMMRAIVPGVAWEYVEAAQMWPLSPLPSSSHLFGVFATERALTPDEITRLEINPVERTIS